ncbi:murein biosynthesis integral membrane protein MurJ [uncultured Vibrio sp.]|uniref:murein biosynthesis integral membrane protein MurJ n=1 Tax=uncultured Vibrio sp. TaxID=114054 RepID=UPI002AA626F1|nr:murein biosynthesis integral membrane protein MurJ [uncultured Vibrio sp.]
MTEQPSARPSGATGKIARSAGAVSIAVMCSRVLGLIREQVFAGMFGAGFAYDAFVVAFRIPNLLRDLFAEGALSAAFVTVFTEYTTNRGAEATWKLAGNVLVFFTLLISALTLIGLYWAEPIVSLLAPDFAQIAGKAELTVRLTRIMFPFLLFVSLAAVVMGMLNTKGKFFVPAMSSTFFNLGSIVGGLSLAWLLPKFGLPAIAGMAWGTLIGGALQLLMQLPTLREVGFRLFVHFNPLDPGLRRILLLMLPATIGLSATQLNIFVNTNFAAGCAEGSVSWLNYAFRLVQLPIGVFGVALSIAVMPVLAKQAAEKDLVSLKQTFTSSLVLVFSLAVPATAGLVLLSEAIIRLIFEHGAFTPLDTIQTADALAFYACGLFAYSAIKVMVPVFYAIGNTKFPVIGSFLGVGANILTITLVIDQLQHRGIALSTSCAMILNFFFLSLVLYRKLNGYPLVYLLKGIGKIVAATALMGGWIFLVKIPLAGWMAGNMAMQILALGLLIASAVGIYAAGLQALGLPEFTLLTGKVVQRFRKS